VRSGAAETKDTPLRPIAIIDIITMVPQPNCSLTTPLVESSLERETDGTNVTVGAAAQHQQVKVEEQPRTTESEALRSSAPQQRQLQQHQEEQQSLSVVGTTEEQTEAQPNPLAMVKSTSKTSSTIATTSSCANETHRISTPQQKQNQQHQHQHQHHIPSYATIHEDQEKLLATKEPTQSSAGTNAIHGTATTSWATEALGTSVPQQQPQPQPQSSVATTAIDTESIRNNPATSTSTSTSTGNHHVNPPTSENPRNSSLQQQLTDKVERGKSATLFETSAEVPAGSSTAASRTTENTKSSVSPVQQQQQQQNEDQGEQQHELPPIVRVVQTEPPIRIQYPEPVRYIIAGVGTSTPCHVHRPTLEELRASSFSDFVRHTVLATASKFLPYSDDDNDDGNIGKEEKKERTNKDETSKEEVATIPAPAPSSTPTPIPTPTPAEATPERTRRKINTPERYRVDKVEEKIHVAKKKTKTKRKDDDEEPEEEEWTQGMAKVSLPVGFWSREGIAGDETARGPAWQAGTQLGDMTLEQPIQQNIRGLAGTYEYTFTEQPSMPMRAFRDKADAYRKSQVGSEVEALEDLTAERLTALERLFWRRLGPTMPAAWYGADQEGTLFGDELAMGWSIGNLDSLLHILSRVPGVTSPYLYAGMWASVFCAHTEDMNLLSINYLHAGAPKIWYAVAPGPDAARFEALAEFQYSVASKECKEFLRHKRCLMSPRVLQKAGIRYTTTVQMPGEAVITFPGGYHFGFNTGFNVAEATNFGVAEWLPFGRRARVCLCRPDSVRIDLWRLTALLRQYKKDKKKEPTLSWKQWGRRREEEDNLRKEKEERKRMKGLNAASPPGKSSPKSKGRGSKKSSKIKPTEQQRKQEFWVEVMRAVTNSKQTTTALSKGVKGKSNRKRKQEKIEESEGDVWHLARPVGRKRLELHTRVLCLVPATVMSSKHSKAKSKVDIDEEQCFSGEVVEIADDCARVHLDGTQKSEDTWIYSKSAKLFLDGGRWSEPDDEDSEVPPKHYWKEVDSKRLCVEK
jgi:hypothetical protein